MKERRKIVKHLMILCAVIVTALGIPSVTKADETNYQAALSTNRAEGKVTYTVKGLLLDQGDEKQFETYCDKCYNKKNHNTKRDRTHTGELYRWRLHRKLFPE